MSFSISPAHNFLEDTPVIIEEQPSNSQTGDNTVQVANNGTTETKDDSNVLSKGVKNSSSGVGLQVHQVSGALDDFY